MINFYTWIFYKLFIFYNLLNINYKIKIHYFEKLNYWKIYFEIKKNKNTIIIILCYIYNFHRLNIIYWYNI